MKRIVCMAAAAGLAACAAPALAYVGPGAGLSLLGALWGLLAAVFAAAGYIVMWPLRRLLRRRRPPGPAAGRPQREGGGGNAGG